MHMQCPGDWRAESHPWRGDPETMGPASLGAMWRRGPQGGPAGVESRWLPASTQALVLTAHPSFQATDKGSRKRYEPSDKDRQSPPPAKRANLSPDRGESLPLEPHFLCPEKC